LNTPRPVERSAATAIYQAEEREASRDGEAPASPSWWALLRRIAVPAALMAAALILPSMILEPGRAIRIRGLGPTAWPSFMLGMLAFLALLWIVHEALAWRRGVRGGMHAGGAATDDEEYDYRKAALAMLGVLAYGYVLPLIGFPLSTAIFIAAVCMLGGLHRPVVVVPVSLIGTAALLWIFVGLALMPLDRGRGPFGQFSLMVLRALGIY
jgi:putative tricarboxylic transport membrane protein